MIVKTQVSEAALLTEIAMKSKSYWGYKQEDLDSWISDLTVTQAMIFDWHVYHYLKDDTVIGFYILNQPNNKNCELEMLFVLPGFIGKGIGSQLIDHAFLRAKELKAKSISLLADPNAVPFYTSKGFIKIDQKESSISGRFLQIMQKDVR